MTTLTVQPSAKDNTLNEGAATTNYGSLTSIYVRSNVTGDYRSVAEFSLADLPAGATISAATLGLYYYTKSEADAVGRTYWAYRLTRTDWVEAESTWNIYKTGSNWTAAGGDYTTDDGASTTVPAGYGWMSWNVLVQVQWAQTNSVAAEFLFRDGTEGASPALNCIYYSNDEATQTTLRPRLVIEYTAGGWANIAKVMGVTATDLAKINNVAVADIAKMNGVTV